MLSALETAAAIQRGELSRADAISAAISRAEQAANLGALVANCFEAARREQPSTGIFAGVPTAIKDLAHLAGTALGSGMDARNHLVSKKDDPFVTKLRALGLVPIGKSATPEFGLTATTEPRNGPPCRNPWDLTRMTGGSSGGAAALVAAGVIPLAHGSDGGGSLRIPAACCGVVGMKPSRGVSDMEGSKVLPINVACDGAITRTVADMAAFNGAFTTSPSRTGPLKIGMFTQAPHATTSQETRDAVLAAARWCEALGHHVEEIPCPIGTNVSEDFMQFWGYVAWLQLLGRRLLHKGFDRTAIEPWTRELASTFRVGKSFAAIRRLRRITRAFATGFTRHDVWLSPVITEPAPTLGYLGSDVPFETQFARLQQFAPFTAVHNVAGTTAISLPLARTATNVPIGVQFAAARGGDRMLLDLASALERAHPWPQLAK